jgi:RNA polymerase sigma factor (sigma-70 family)
LEGSFETIIDLNKGKIYRICKVYAQRPIEPEDLFHEVVFQAWKSFPKFKGQSSVSTWLYRIALNVAIGAKTKFSREKENLVQLESIQFIDEEVDDHKERKLQALHACITHLSEADKAIIVLFLEGLPYKEIGEVTGLSENHIAVKMKRARAKLFDCITHKIA